MFGSTGVLSLLVMMLAVIGVFADIPLVSNYAFWFVIAAYVIFDRGKNWLAMLTDLLLGLAVVGVFIDIPFVSNYAFWVAIAAYIIRLVTKIPKSPTIPIRVSLGS